MGLFSDLEVSILGAFRPKERVCRCWRCRHVATMPLHYAQQINDSFGWWIIIGSGGLLWLPYWVFIHNKPKFFTSVQVAMPRTTNLFMMYESVVKEVNKLIFGLLPLFP